MANAVFAHPKPAEDEFVTWQMHPAPREFRPAPVFLDWDGKGDFPFRASNEPLKHRSWCAISYPNPSAEVEVGEGVTAHTGVLFQPTAIAGDRFKLNVVLAIPEPDGKLCADAAGDVLPTDADRHEDNYLDLPALAAETGVPRDCHPNLCGLPGNRLSVLAWLGYSTGAH